jgi:hypothetical protein
MPIRTNRGRVAVYRKLWGWPMRSPRHLLATGLVVLAVVLTIVLIMPKLTGSDHPSGAAATLGGSSPTSSQAGPVGGQGPGAAAGGQTTRTPAPSSAVTTRLTAPTQTPTPAPPAQQALDVAGLWAKAWVNHPQGVTNEQWLNGMRPYTTEEQLAVMSTVDPANVPATAVTGNPVAKTSYTTSVEATVPTNGGTLSITVIFTPQGWRVSYYQQAA